MRDELLCLTLFTKSPSFSGTFHSGFMSCGGGGGGGGDGGSVSCQPVFHTTNRMTVTQSNKRNNINTLM